MYRYAYNNNKYIRRENIKTNFYMVSCVWTIKIASCLMRVSFEQNSKYVYDVTVCLPFDGVKCQLNQQMSHNCFLFTAFHHPSSKKFINWMRLLTWTEFDSTIAARPYFTEIHFHQPIRLSYFSLFYNLSSTLLNIGM